MKECSAYVGPAHRSGCAAAQGHARSHRRRPSGLRYRSTAALGLYANLKLKSRWRSRIAYVFLITLESKWHLV